MNIEQADKFFSTLNNPKLIKRYTNYWESIKPVTIDDFFRRYLFAFTSVHSTWQSNLRGYLALRGLEWVNNKENLISRLVWAKCGMYRNRTQNIWAFKEKFYDSPEFFCEIQADWRTHRNNLVKVIDGLGITKVSFALEMCFPKEALVSCIDTHGLKLYEFENSSFTTKKGLLEYEDAEDHWIDASVECGCSPTVARAIYWDKKQKQKSSRYWTYVLEEK